ncbi:MAG: ornithine carbamoyltransferase [Gammaproteobacteria bacterium]|tara:strand:- start:110 stop:1027 length:918 start_codon:yes stop_codon:yes gene_type:complete
MNKVRHFRSLLDINRKEFIRIIERSIELKKEAATGIINNSLSGKTMAMIFKKNSTRTRVAFETAMTTMGGHAIFLSSDSTQLSRGEELSDTAKVLSGMVDIIVVRTHDHNEVEELALNSRVPVINGLTEKFHPCQLLADMQTYYEVKGSIEGKKVAWVGDGCNMCNSYINAAKILNFNLSIATPSGFEPDKSTLSLASDNVELCDLPGKAVEDCDLVTTDVWSSMGDEGEAEKRKILFKGYQINKHLFEKSKNDSIFLHCLPAHRDEEVDSDVIDGSRSKVWQQAHNRLYTSKALIEFLLQESKN